MRIPIDNLKDLSLDSKCVARPATHGDVVHTPAIPRPLVLLLLMVIVTFQFPPGALSHAGHKTSESTTAKKSVVSSAADATELHYQYMKQGYDLGLLISNFSVIGHAAAQDVLGDRSRYSSVDSLIGCRYPFGSPVEHIYGGGPFVIGIMKTINNRSGTYAIFTTQGYSTSGGNSDFAPYSGSGDHIWVTSKGSPKPAGWDKYWGGAVPFNPVSDQDCYSTCTDTLEIDRLISANLQPPPVIPPAVKIIQKSYAWQGGYADAIIPIEYDLINVSRKMPPLTDLYVGFVMDPDVGPYYVTTENGYQHNYWDENYAAYIPQLRTAYTVNPVDPGSTPIGVTFCGSPQLFGAPKYTFAWYSSGEPHGYDTISTGRIWPDQKPNQLSDVRVLFAFGPLVFGVNDTLKMDLAIVAGQDINQLKLNAERALVVYKRHYTIPVTPPSPPLKITTGFKSVTLNWKWQPGDPGVDPETVVDTGNPAAMSDSTRNGRIFEGYRVYRSTHPSGGTASYTLLKQYDIGDYGNPNTGGLHYTYTDSNLVRGQTYWYAVTSYSIPEQLVLRYRSRTGTSSIDTVYAPPQESSIASNAKGLVLPFSVSDKLGQVQVVPNPYRTDENYTLENGGWEGRSLDWNETDRVIKFIHLPSVCTIRVFTIAGGLVGTIQHRPGVLGYNPEDGEATWHLMNNSRRTLASGIYVFTVTSKLGTQVGKFVVIK